jgi:hypothetical protein
MRTLSSQPAPFILRRRPRAPTVALAAVMCLLGTGLAACGADDHSPTTGTSPQVSDKAPPAVPAAASLGCHQYCQQAGGYGGGEAGRPATDFVRIRNARTGFLRGGALPVTVTCLQATLCRGAILLSPASTSDIDVIEFGRSDLDVGGNRTRTIAVPITPRAIRAVRARHRGRFPVDVLVDFGNPSCPPDSELPCVADRRIVIDTRGAG